LPVPPLNRPSTPYPLETYRPAGEVEPPFILVEGGEKSGKTYTLAEATADPRICHTWWIEIGEKPSANEYGGKIPGARFSIVRHDGTFWSVLSLVEQISVHARDMIDHDRAPMIVIDTAAGVWETVKALGQARTMASPSVQRKIQQNPAARADNHPITQNTWNDVIDEWYRLIRVLQRFPGIAVVISRGKEVTAVDDDGKPTGERTYRVEGHKNLAYDCSAWVRMSRDGKPLVISARTALNPVRPGVDKPRRYEGLPELVFDTLEYRPAPWEPDLAEQAHRQRVAGEPDPVPVDWGGEFAAAQALDVPRDRRDALVSLWRQASEAQQRSRSVPVGLVARIEQAGHAAADAWRIEVSQAWDDAEDEQVQRTTDEAIAAIADMPGENGQPADELLVDDEVSV
jgi:hypothetical protein